MAKHNDIGKIGEDIAVKRLKQQGFKILERNYRKKWGEIDIVARGTLKVHFIEVKTVSYETEQVLEVYVSRETYRPEEKVDFNKKQRLSRVIETWLQEHPEVSDFQIDILTVHVVPREKYAKVKIIENVILE